MGAAVPWAFNYSLSLLAHNQLLLLIPTVLDFRIPGFFWKINICLFLLSKIYFSLFSLFLSSEEGYSSQPQWDSRYFSFRGDFHLLYIFQEFFTCLKVPFSMFQYYSGFVLLLMLLMTF